MDSDLIPPLSDPTEIKYTQNRWESQAIKLSEYFINFEKILIAMLRLQLNDFINPSTLVCFNLCLENLYDWEFEELNDEGFDREKFRDLLVKYELQEFTDWLIEYQMIWNHVQELFLEGRKEDDRFENLQSHSLKIAEILKLLITNETKGYKNMEISVSNLTNKIGVTGIELFDHLKLVFIKEFERLGLNKTNLTIEEVIEDLEDIPEDAYFEEYGCTTEEILSEPYYQEKYRLDYVRPREVTLDIVNMAISKIKTTQSKNKRTAGAKVKNLANGELAKRLSYLHKIRPFLNQNEYSSIKSYPLSNETCRFIYEYFDFWDLLPAHIRFERSDKEKRSNYIKSLIRNNEKYFRKNFSYTTIDAHMPVYDEKLEYNIDLFKKVKDGEISPDQYYLSL